MDHISFKKGEEFERFVEDYLFNKEDYVLVHRTNSFEQNRIRYAEDSMKPDFKFRCSKSNKEFYVEAKYRSRFNNDDKLDVISAGQLTRFNAIQNAEQIPVYIVIGYQGYPSNPANISLIPISELIYLELYASFLNKFKIEKGRVDGKNLVSFQKVNFGNDSFNTTEVVQESLVEEPTKNKKSFKYSKLAIGLAIILFLCAVGLYFFNSDQGIEKKLRQKTFEYYQTVESNNIEGLEAFLNPVVFNWYDNSDMTLEQIKKDAREYRNKFPNSTTEIQWDSFEVTPFKEDYMVTYKLIYKMGSEGKFKNKIFHLQIRAIWSDDFKIKSLSERRI